MRSTTTRFLVPFGVLAILMSAFVLQRAYTASRQHAHELVSQQAALALRFNVAIRTYVAATIRPALQKLIDKDEFIPEVMSASLISRNVFELVRQDFPDYVIRFASEQPRNPSNQAQPSEERLINYFREHPDIVMQSGEIELDGRRYLAQYMPRWLKPECLRCHGDPADAPAAIVQRYGPTASFHRKVGDLASIETVAIPIETMNAALAAEARQQSAILAGGLVLLFVAVIVVFRFVVTRRLTTMARHFQAITEQTDAAHLQPVNIGGRDEIGVLAGAFNSLVERLRTAQLSLEQRVGERTAELARSNTELGREIAERQRFEEALRTSEQRYRTTFDRAPVGISHVAPDGHWLWVNQRLCDIVGYTRDELLARTFQDITHPDDLAPDMERLRQLMAGEMDSFTAEKRYLRKTGEPVWVALSVATVRRPSGAPDYFITVVEDITARRQMQAEYDRLFNLSLDMLCIAGFDGHFRLVNPAWYQALGWSDPELLSTPWLDFVHPEDRAATMAAGNELRAGRAVRAFENRYRCKDGSYRWLSWNSFPLIGEERIFAVVRDVTERKQAEESLRQSEATLRSIFTAAPIGVGLVSNRVFRRVNEQLCRLVGYTADELIGQSARLIYPSDAEFEWVGQEKYRQIREKGTGTVETRWQCKDGHCVDVLLSSTPLEPDNLAAGVTFTALDITDRKRAEEALRRQAAFNASVLDTVDSLIIVLDRQGRIVMFNHACERCTGYSADEACNQFLWDLLLLPEEQAAVREVFDDLRHHALPTRYANYWRTKDGRRRWIQWSNTVLCDPDGAVEYLLGTGLDITEQRQVEAEMENLARFPEENPYPVLRVDAAGTVLYTNPASAALAQSEELVVGHKAPAHWCSWVVVALADGQTHEIEITCGERTYVCVLAPVAAAQYVNIYGRDITERKRMEDALRTSESFLSSIINQSPYPMWIADAHGTLVRINQACCNLLRVTEEEVVGKYNILKDNLVAEQGYLPLVQRVFEAGEAVRFEIAYNTAQLRSLPLVRTTTVFLDVTVFPIRNASGTIVSAVIQHLDITARKQAEQDRAKLEAQLRQAQKMEAIGQLAGGVAHDFNNILTAILGQIELTQQGLARIVPADDPLLQGLHMAEQSGQRAAGLTRQLLAFSRRQVTQPTVFDFNQALTDMEKMLRRLLTEDIELVLNLGRGLHAIRADLGQTEQVVMNLVVNARDAMPDGGRLLIETADVELDDAYAATHPDASIGPHVVLVVSDTGCGMGPATLEHIFEPFFSTKPAGQGTGLGLATIYGIIKQAGGHVTVYSEPGHGSTFRVYWPAVEAAAMPTPTRSKTAVALRGTETVLLCEDDESVRELAQAFLRSAGYTVLVAGRGDEALARAAEHTGTVDLLVTDVIMPDMNGKRLADLLTAQRPDLRTLFVSGYTADVIAHHGVLDEGVEFLEKPFGRQRLLERIREVLTGGR